MKLIPLAVTGALLVSLPSELAGQSANFERLPAETFDVRPPSEWVRGVPGSVVSAPLPCRSATGAELRRRIVDVAVQEWAFFGFPVLDRADDLRLLPPGAGPASGSVGFEPHSRRPPLLSPVEAARVATTISGYWAATPDGAWVLEEQNRVWNGSRGIGARWAAPWSAAFISWVMCEAGLEGSQRFRRGIAHHAYIDQAIRARDGHAPEAGFVAYDVGEAEVRPGDLLCAARRPAYRGIAERRRQLGEGAATHCDIVVSLDEGHERILAVGGNVLRAVSLKVLPATAGPDGGLRPVVQSSRPLFAHLSLRADPIESDPLSASPAFQAFSCPSSGPTNGRIALIASALGVGVNLARSC